MFQGTRSAILKLTAIIVIVIAVDQTLRKQILQSPGEVVEKYMLKVGLHIKGGLAKSFPERVRQQCGDKDRKAERKQKEQSYYFLIKSKTSGRKNVLLCVPPRLASKQALEYLSSLFDEPCRDRRLKSCAVQPQFEPDNNTLSAVMVRHPFDRLIIEYKRQKYQDSDELNNFKSNIPGRQILLSRHRTGHGRKKNKREFREFIRNSLLADNSNSSVESITEICNVCSRHYDVAVKLDEGQEIFGELLSLVGNNNEAEEMGAAKQKTFGQKLQRKYFSEITADEMEKLVRKFESDFLIFGYTFEQYKKALKSH